MGRNTHRILIEKLEGRRKNKMEDLSVNGKILLKLGFKN
jgi:hypothetical protein